jgi:hypothetical protein
VWGHRSPAFGAAAAAWSGALTPPPALRAHALTLTLLCDGPCALLVDGALVAEWREVSGAGAPVPPALAGAPRAPTVAVGPPPGAAGGGMEAAAGAAELASAALRACGGLPPHAPPGAAPVAALSAPPLALPAGNPVALRVVLRPRGAEGARGEGVAVLLWGVGAAAGEAPPRGAAHDACPDGVAPVPVEALSWAAEPLQGSPAPVWLE